MLAGGSRLNGVARSPGVLAPLGFLLASLNSLYSKLSTRASQLASMMFSLTPTVLQTSAASRDSITTRTLAAVPARALTTRTL